MNKSILFVLLSLLITSKVSLAADTLCTVNNGIVTFPAGDACVVEPDYYSVVLYELRLCTAMPVAPTTTSSMNLSACQLVFKTRLGERVVIKNRISSPLWGYIKRPSNGSYSYGYVRLNKDFALRASLKFDQSVIADSGDGSGVYCATKFTTSAPGVTSPVATIKCGSAPQTAGTLTSPLVAMDTSPYSAIGSDTNLIAYLVDSSRQLATGISDVSQVVVVQTFTTPVVISDSSKNMDVSFAVTKGLSIDDGANDTAGTASFMRGPLSVKMTVSN
jgi:hypothetical protein